MRAIYTINKKLKKKKSTTTTTMWIDDQVES